MHTPQGNNQPTQDMDNKATASPVEYPHGHPFWLHKPEKEELEYDPDLTLMDLFQSGGAFVSGINGRTTHADSYMTVLDYDAARKTYEIIQAEYQLDRSVWVRFAEEYLIGHTNPQPIPTLLGRHILSMLPSES